MPDRFSNGDKGHDFVQGMNETTLNRDSMYYRHGGDIQGIINHLIESKKAANRPKDKVDVIYLEKIKRLLEEQNKS